LALQFVSEVEDMAYVTASLSSGAEAARRGTDWAAAEAYTRIGGFLVARQMQIVHERIFGSLSARQAILEQRARALAVSAVPADGPITYIQGKPLSGDGLSGVQLLALRPQEPSGVWTIRDAGVACGRGWRRNGVRFLVLQSVHGLLKGLSREAQAGRMLDGARRILRAQGVEYDRVARTWIYLSDILSWYDEFNKARNAKYGRFGLMPDLSAEPPGRRVRLPASTGIEGDNPLGAACAMDVLAVSGEPDAGLDAIQMTNVKQADAFRYGSAFSRGVCIREPDVAQIQISGTAAIDERGNSLFPGDAPAQILWTLDSVQALIAPEGATLSDISQATVFLKRAEDYSTYGRVFEERGLADLPVVCVQADVCRDELLFEMDGVALLRRDSSL
jgi:enamine deaminase RidA (YjgF/YER057c/UK114 family)